MSAVLADVGSESGFVYSPRPASFPVEPIYRWQRRFELPKFRLVGSELEEYSDCGASVFRNADLNSAELEVQISVNRQRMSCTLELTPAALVELAQRLLDAAHDIDIHPASSLE